MKDRRIEPSAFWAALDVEKALSILEKESIPPPSIETFSTILFKCRQEKSKEHILRLHRHMLKTCLEAHSILGNRMVATLVDIGSMDDAREVFDGLEYRNDMSWHALVAGYLKQQKPQHAIFLYTRMQDNDRVNLSGRTFVAFLKACLMLQDFNKGLEIHSEVVRLGFFGRDLFIGSTLIDFYAKFGEIVKAKEIFDKLANRDVVLWNVLITAYVKHGFGQEALNFFHQMKLQGTPPNSVTFICTLKACAMLGTVEEIAAIHVEAERKDLLINDHVLSCTMVDVYAKCGHLAKAKDVFDAQPVHSVVSWTALISGYAEHEHGTAALAAHAKMHDEGFCPNAVTYIGLLKACSCLTDGEAGRVLHCDLSRLNLQKNDLNIGNALIDMYCKCGLLANACEVFNKLVNKDVVSWNTLLNGFGDEGSCSQALDLFERMQLTLFSPNCVTYSIVLKACGSIKSSNKGQQIHLEIQKRGLFEGERLIGNELADMYAKCGLFQEAQHVFRDLSLQDVFSWNALLVGYTENQSSEVVLELFEEMQLAGIAPDAISLNCSLKACGTIGEKNKGEQMHAEAVKIGLLKVGPMITDALVDMYAKCGFLATAQHVFDELGSKDALTWNKLISGYTDWGYGRKAVELLSEMELHKVSPDVVTFVCGLKACGIVGAIDKGIGLHAEIARQGLLEFDFFLGNTLVDMYAKCNMLSAAHETFDRLPCQDTVAWNVLLAGYVDHGHNTKALERFRSMQRIYMFADDVTFVICLRACSNAGAVDEGQDIHSEIEKKGFFGMVYVSTALVDMYAKFGLLLDAEHLFHRHLIQDLHLWNVLIAGYIEHGQSEKALDCLGRMQSKGVSPDVITHVHSLKACGCLGAIEKGAGLHIDITKMGLLENDITLGNALIGMYSNCGSLAHAHNVFDRLHCRDICTWNALIAGYDELMDTEDVFMVFDKMLDYGMKPDSVTFILLLNACSRRGLMDRANQYFMLMSAGYGIEPISEHFTCMVDLLGRIGHINKAVTSIKESSSSCDSAVRHSILCAFKKWGAVDPGDCALEQAVRLDENDGIQGKYSASRCQWNVCT